MRSIYHKRWPYAAVVAVVFAFCLCVAALAADKTCPRASSADTLLPVVSAGLLSDVAEMTNPEELSAAIAELGWSNMKAFGVTRIYAGVQADDSVVLLGFEGDCWRTAIVLQPTHTLAVLAKLKEME